MRKQNLEHRAESVSSVRCSKIRRMVNPLAGLVLDRSHYFARFIALIR
ncbi:hypothetical protein GGQ71_001043 [Rhizobium taibaishanense]|uniref:Uncharacterized protein n=1 Tax=Allorhizobium taibaishanense TaxID=887144 RepID=A0A7W6HKZ2_9HYPH|nr:hypothetical protein [Allorhizobium taibaishanense]